MRPGLSNILHGVDLQLIGKVIIFAAMKLWIKYVISSSACLIAALIFLWVWTDRIERRHDDLSRQEAELNGRLQDWEDTLHRMARRDNLSYRRALNLPAVPDSVRCGEGDLVQRLPVMTEVQDSLFNSLIRSSLKYREISSHIPSIVPMDPSRCKLSSQFGTRSDPFTKQYKTHQGVDLSCQKNEPVYAAADGMVAELKTELNGYGIQVVIDHGYGYRTRYAHLAGFNVPDGVPVRRGDVIGFAGSTGRATGVHLHYEVIYRGEHVDPMDYMDLSMLETDFDEVAHKIEVEQGKMYVHPKHRSKK